MTMQLAEADWLEGLIEWTVQCDRMMDSLESRSDKLSDTTIDTGAWQLRFRELGEMAEAYRERLLQDEETAITADEMELLNEKAHQLRSELVQLMAENGSEELLEDNERNADDEERKSTTTVPIGGHTLPPLPYDYNALEPHISEEIMRLHHAKHHQSYVDGLNKAEKEMQKARETGDFSLIRHWEGEAAFNGAGHYLHTIFWENMSPNGGGKPGGEIAKEIQRTFGNFNQFKAHFSKAAENVQGVGWALLVWSPRSHRTEILQAEKHQNLSQQDVIPLLVLDVWEHAYYLQYYNNRKDYIKAWWNIVCWDSVNRRFNEARKVKWQPY
ncbi:superoxide dismutase, Fe-Mn family [Lentibacillus persicus]|uniref:superoxide dismutase n=1 Tax=Lentibacillus persicus TaxID=640948 RepID=A0A1I1UBZ1_9BACI|nr:superoxide dismutase [Lentibacillus persicus]SFD68391.1 superoxide dismutase, Fe-Mn family [Lentibacillus persicus]